MKHKILIVEDDSFVAEGLAEVLKSSNYDVIMAKSEKQVCELILKNEPDLVILDINLGQENGIDICKSIRKQSNIPVLFLTAYSGEVELVRAFRSGGDDYLTKPFRMQELLLRIEALLRRSHTHEDEKITSGDLIYTKSEQTLRNARSGEIIELTPVERKLLLKILLNYPQTITRDQLLFDVWDKDAIFVDENALRVNISRLREKIGTFHEKLYIETVRGVGYRWSIAVHQ
jgi:DNA-binding response OmpR family regulator